MAKIRSDIESCRSSRRAFPIVGVGASAGGLEVFSELLRHLPKKKLVVPPQVRRFPENAEIALFRVIQKSLNNLHRRSPAKKARVEIRQNSEAVLPSRHRPS
jgi:hypothetical protein